MPPPQNRRGSDTEKRSVDSKGDTAGGRAMPIKQVSVGSLVTPLPTLPATSRRMGQTPDVCPHLPERSVEARWKFPQQRVEEEICDPEQQRHAVLPLEL